MSFEVSNTSTKNMIVDYLTVSDDALFHIKELISQRKEPCDGIKIGLRTRGCSGMSYTIEYAEKEKNISKFDEVVIKDGINVFIDAKASMFLIGTQMIYKTDELNSGFDFVNPNESGRCGCGESFKL